MNPKNEISQARFEAAEAFLHGKMQAAEQAEFAEKLDTDPDFEADFVKMRDLIMAAEEAGLREDLERAHRSIVKPSQRNFSWFSMAAVFLLLIAAAGWWFFPRETKLNPDDALFAQYVATDPGLPVPMSASAAKAYNFYDAMVDYKTEDYSRAAEKWRELAVSSPENDTLKYYIGAAEFNAGHYAEAAAQFELVLTSGTSVFADKARLYLALSMLKTGEARHILALEVPEGVAYADTLDRIKRQIGNR